MKDNFKRFFRPVYRPIIDWWNLFCTRRKNKIRILSSRKTIKYIQKKHCSISRFGDGEFTLLFEDKDIGFQNTSTRLSEKIGTVFSNPSPNLLICLPNPLFCTRGMTRWSAQYWNSWCLAHNHYAKIAQYVSNKLGNTYIFGDAMITRPYMDWKNKKRAKKIFVELKKIWNQKNLLIVEGEQTRLGIGNDLFNNAKSIKRILCPATNAFDVYDDILISIQDIYTDEIVLAALGPTATILAADLSHLGIQTLDIGHIDIEYMWFLSQSQNKFAIPGKYTNEVLEGHTYTICNDISYQNQIVKRLSPLDQELQKEIKIQ